MYIHLRTCHFWNSHASLTKKILQADPPQLSRIPEKDIVGVTVLLLTCSYQGQEFIRVGYYVNNDYIEESLREEPPASVIIDKVQRNILADKPRVTKFPIVYHSSEPVMAPVEPELVHSGCSSLPSAMDVSSGCMPLPPTTSPMINCGMRSLQEVCWVSFEGHSKDTCTLTKVILLKRGFVHSSQHSQPDMVA